MNFFAKERVNIQIQVYKLKLITYVNACGSNHLAEYIHVVTQNGNPTS